MDVRHSPSLLVLFVQHPGCAWPGATPFSGRRRSVAGIESARRGSCRYVVRDANTVVSLPCCSPLYVCWEKRGPVTCQGTSSWREHSEQGWLMNRIARGCASKPGGFAGYLGNWPASPRQREVLRSSRARGRKVAVLARPVEEEHAAVLAFLADGESWSSSSLAHALGASQRTVQRALDSLAAAGKVQSLGRARARRWITPPVPGFTTILLLPAPLPGD